MNALIRLHNGLFDHIEKLAPTVMPTLARFLFAAVLFLYYWNSAITKLGKDGISALFSANANMFGQMFPKAAEAVFWDISQATAFQKAVMLAGTWAEFILRILIVIGLFTRLAAIGMIGFVIVQSVVDLFGHGGLADPATFGAWFDRLPSSAIMDQRALWVFLLLYLVFRGAGPLSLDRFVFDRSASQSNAA